MIEAGRIVARLCRVYGWTPDYCLDRLTWSQCLMYHAYADGGETEYRAPVNRAAEEQPPHDMDAPDEAAIEALGDRIRRVTSG